MDISPTAFVVQPSSGVPIYRQLIDQVRGMVAAGRVRSGDVLPSVRQLAAELGVNFMTISKAWAKLESEGLVEHVRGRGVLVAASRQSAVHAEHRPQVKVPSSPFVGAIRNVPGLPLHPSAGQVVALMRMPCSFTSSLADIRCGHGTHGNALVDWTQLV